MKAWSLYTHVLGNTYAGHEGYDDVLGFRYSYDSGVPNHLQVSVGDLIVPRDGSGSLGAAFVERIADKAGTKTRRRCPTCTTPQIEERISMVPRYRCTKGHVFDDPRVTEDAATLYRAEYGKSFAGTTDIGPDELEALCLARSWQNAIREIDLDRTLAALRRRGILPAFTTH